MTRKILHIILLWIEAREDFSFISLDFSLFTVENLHEILVFIIYA